MMSEYEAYDRAIRRLYGKDATWRDLDEEQRAEVEVEVSTIMDEDYDD